MNEHLTVQPYVTKTELYERFGRHPRTITGDLNHAIAKQDKELLLLSELHTKNGDIISGVDVTEETWKELVARGDNPVWYFDPSFVEIVRKRKSKRRRLSSKPHAPEPSEPSGQSRPSQENSNNLSGENPKLPSDPATRAIVLEHLHYNDQKHKNDNKELMDRILGLVETNQELQRQTNTLFNQFQEFLKRPQTANFLPANSDSVQPSDKSVKKQQAITVNTAENKSETVKKTNVPRRRKKTANPKSNRIKKTTKKVVTKKKKTSPKWYSVPTLKKLLTR